MIETWGFSEVIKDIGTDDNDANNPDDNNNDNDGNNDKASQLWDLIETWGFREDIKDIIADEDIDDNNDNDDKGISALGLDRDMGFSREHQ